MKRLELQSTIKPTSLTTTIVDVNELTSTSRAVRLTPDYEIDSLASELDHLDLIIVTFPIFRDGRGYTQARTLREYYKYQGEIRAEGHLIPDQALYLRSCGVDCVMLPDDADREAWERALSLFPKTYQERLGIR